MTNKKKKIKITKQDKILLATFIGLIILVAVLGILALNIDKISNNKKINLTIPILESKMESEISIDVSDMALGEKKEYIFKVTNYKDSKILSESTTYNIKVTKSENTSIKIYKNSSARNLFDDNYTIEKIPLKSSKKVEDTYKLIIEATLEPTETENIAIKITS